MNIMQDQNTGVSEKFKYVYGTKPANIYINGVFDGATVMLQAQSPSGDWVDVREGEISAPVMTSFECFPFTGRFEIRGEGAATSISIDVVGSVVV